MIAVPESMVSPKIYVSSAARQTGRPHRSASVARNGYFERMSKLWPIHPKPCEDELLSCWMVRIARAYGRKPGPFWTEVWREGSLSFREIDPLADESLLRLLSLETGTSYERMVGTTVRAYEAYSSTTG
jgi:hypothetical protein